MEKKDRKGKGKREGERETFRKERRETLRKKRKGRDGTGGEGRGGETPHQTYWKFPKCLEIITTFLLL